MKLKVTFIFIKKGGVMEINIICLWMEDGHEKGKIYQQKKLKWDQGELLLNQEVQEYVLSSMMETDQKIYEYHSKN